MTCDDMGEKVSFWRRALQFFKSFFSRKAQNQEATPFSHGSDLLHSPSNCACSEEEGILKNIALLRETHVEDIMIPRSQIEALDIEASLREALELFEESGYSRMPVYAQTLDDPRGMIHMRDILNYLTRSARKLKEDNHLKLSSIALSTPLKDLDVIRSVLFVPGSMLASQLFRRMQATRTQMALIIDEYGGTDGLASMEDIVELILGDIEDEHDCEDIMILREPDDTWLIDARAELEEVQEALQGPLHWTELAQDVDTIGGLVVSLLERIPVRGEVIENIPGYRIRILEADKRRIKKLRLKKLNSASSS